MITLTVPSAPHSSATAATASASQAGRSGSRRRSRGRRSRIPAAAAGRGTGDGEGGEGRPGKEGPGGEKVITVHEADNGSGVVLRREFCGRLWWGDIGVWGESCLPCLLTFVVLCMPMSVLCHEDVG